MKERAIKIPQDGQERLTEALERLVQLYEAVNKPEQAATWRKELKEFKKPAVKP
jgi:hypothetical protein